MSQRVLIVWVGFGSDFNARWLGVRLVTSASDALGCAVTSFNCRWSDRSRVWRYETKSLVTICAGIVVFFVRVTRGLRVCIHVLRSVVEVFSSGARFPGIFTPRGRRVTLARVGFGGRNTAPLHHTVEHMASHTHTHSHTYTQPSGQGKRQLYPIHLMSLRNWSHIVVSLKQCCSAVIYCEDKWAIHFLSAYLQNMKDVSTNTNVKTWQCDDCLSTQMNAASVFGLASVLRWRNCICWCIGSIIPKWSSCEKQIFHRFHDVRIMYVEVNAFPWVFWEMYT